ncbi:MAG: NYN domain-containing protein [Candidatus Latescibacteria bacterium]|nr:NYN domain-containing protein [Candidatus Latescibacterota bacterium]
MKRLQEATNAKRHIKHASDPDRVGIFVDVQNIFYAAKQFNARLDFEKLLRTSVGHRRLIRAIAYVIQSPEVDQSGFITMLQQKNYEVKRKNLRLRSDGSAKGDWDMGMAIDMISLADRLDVVVLVSGDGDFVSLVNLIKTMGPRVEVFSFLHNTAKDLMQAADSHYSIEEGLLLKLNNTNGDGNE